MTTIGGVRVRRRRGERAFFFVSGMTIDADGAPNAYHPNGSPPGLDHLANAGRPGNWWALVTDAKGNPIVQRPRDPAPGFYVSMTALIDPTKPRPDPRRYVNAARVPFVVLPARALEAGGARLGDMAAVFNRRNEKLAFAIVADVGPRGKIGEGSIALARALGIPSNPKAGGQSSDVVYVVFARTGNGRPRPIREIQAIARDTLMAWGGVDRLRRIR